MEARKEEMQKEKEEDEMGKAREVIRNTIIITKADDYNLKDGDGGDTQKKMADNNLKIKKAAEEEEDVLAYSRAVNQTDSSLE